MDDSAKTQTTLRLPPIRRLEILNHVASVIAGNSSLDSIVQTITDAAAELTGAQFGAFFYNVLDDRGESYMLYALSGAPRSAFEKFGMPRNTAVFDHTFRGLGVVRSDDIKADPRYGLLAPHYGMPKGHLPVTSYLAAPVISRSGEIHGGLFFGHQEARVFTAEDEADLVNVAAQAALAVDNTRLLEGAQRFASIVESSDDAIISKDLNGIIRSWNRGAERIFGYAPSEILGRSILTLIPDDLHHEEPDILARIGAGQRVDHFETIRQRKDGTRFHVSVTISPIRDRTGQIVGASKIARDIDIAVKAHENQSLLLREMNHRVKNLFAVASGVVALSARSAQSAPELARNIQERLTALARAHDLTVIREGQTAPPAARLADLVKTLLSPYDTKEGRICVNGPDIDCNASASTSFALLLHEFATNSVKYGALSLPTGQVTIAWTINGNLALTWKETGGPVIDAVAPRQGFGSTLADLTTKAMDAKIERSWPAEGLILQLTVPLKNLAC